MNPLEETKRQIAQNLQNIKETLQNIPHREDITLLAATKTISPEWINYATETLGITDIGENKVQELLEKYDRLQKENVNIHFIGHLQTNKVKYIIDKVYMIHSLDSLKLAEEINKQAAKKNIIMKTLIEINIGHEENKSGIFPENLPSFLEQLTSFDHINVCGLMTMAPVCEKKEDYSKYFAKTYKLFIDNRGKKLHNIDIHILSMGMSDSYVQAVEEGATIIRLGTALFGKRNYPKKEN